MLHWMALVALWAIWTLCAPRLGHLIAAIAWPQLYWIRRTGRIGLLASWLLLEALLLAVGILLLWALRRAGVPVVWREQDLLILVIAFAAGSVVMAFKGYNPTAGLDGVNHEAQQLIARLKAEDVSCLEETSAANDSDLEIIARRQPTPAYLEHLRRVIRRVPRSENHGRLVGFAALDILGGEIARVLAVLDREGDSAGDRALGP